MCSEIGSVGSFDFEDDDCESISFLSASSRLHEHICDGQGDGSGRASVAGEREEEFG